MGNKPTAREKIKPEVNSKNVSLFSSSASRPRTQLLEKICNLLLQVASYCWNTGGGPLTRFHFRLTFTSTRLAILMKGMLLFMP